MVDSLIDYCENNTITYDARKDKLISRGRVIDMTKKYMDYASVTPPGRTIDVHDFSVKAYEIMKQRYEDNLNKPAYDGFLFDTVDSIDDLVDQAMVEEELLLSEHGDQIRSTRTNSTMRRDDAELLILSHGDRYNEESRDLSTGKSLRSTYNVENLKRAFRAKSVRLAHEHRANTVNSLKYKGEEAAEYASSCIDYLLDGFYVDKKLKPVYKLVFMQWMWTVKAYMYGKVVKDPLLLNIYSPDQGIGKSNVILRIAEPLKDFTEADAPLRYAIDPREHHRFGEKYIIMFDELAVGGNDNEYKNIIAAFKKILTASEINPRELGSQREIKMDRIAAAISTSNNPLSDTLFDDTGMRRFFEITVQRPPGTPEGSRNDDLLDYWMKKGEDNFDPKLFWEGINENLVDGYAPPRSPELEMIQKQQKVTNKVVDTVKMILDSEDFMYTPSYVADADMDEVEKQVSRFKKGSTSKKMGVDLGYDLIALPRFRKELVETLEEEFGSGSGRYVKQLRRFSEDMERRGILLISFENTLYVACDTISNVGVGRKKPQ